MKTNKWIVAILAILVFSSMSYGQTNSGSKKLNYKKNPVWIQMMNDPKANFFETVEAFKEYYEDRALPEEPKEIRAGDSFERDLGLEEYHENGKKSEKEIERERKRDNSNEQIYSAEVRAFKGWYYGNLGWLRADGSIITVAERQAIIDKQQNELKEAENADKLNNQKK